MRTVLACNIKSCLFFIAFIGLVTNSLAGGRSIPPGNAGDNIAYGKTYVFSANPNYSGCTDSGDLTQLTDNYNYTGANQLWIQFTTVGWQNTNPVITFDLGVVQPIQGVSFATGSRSVSSVLWPTAINLKVSNDNINYYSAGDLVSLSNQENGAPPAPDNTIRFHTYSTTALNTHGRFVRFEVTRNGSFVFVDEIKIIRGANTLLGQNIALNKTYTLTPSPNYSLCTESGDATQLTDGAYYTGGGTLWSQPMAVGWQWTVNPEIRIDLGSKQPIEGISFNTTVGLESGGVTSPIAITVLVSDDNTTYYKAGELVSLSVEHGVPVSFTQVGSLIHSYWTDRMVTSGRYVKIIPSSGGLFVFTDEIEVYKGLDGMLNASRGSAITDVPGLLKKDRIRGGIARRVSQDIQDVRTQTDAEAGLNPTVKSSIVSLLNTSVSDIMYQSDMTPSTFLAKLPLNTAHTRVFSALQQLWQAQGKSGLIGWLTTPCDPLNPTQPVGSIPASTGLSVTMMQGEYRTSSFNLTNASAGNMAVSLNITGLPDGTNPSYIKVKEVAWTDTLAGVPVATALPDAAKPGAYTINVPAGMTTQVCLVFHPTNVSPNKFGVFSGSITADGVTVPVTLNLSPLNFPASPVLSLGGWDYTNLDSYSGMSLTNRSALITLMQEYFVDTTWATNAVMPSPYSATQFDNWKVRWTNAHHYRIFLNVGTTFGGYAMGTSGFNTEVANWINAYASHWTSLGLNLNHIGLHLADEPNEKDTSKADRIINWSNAIKAAQPNLKIWTNPVYSNPNDGTSLFAACDILSPHRPWFITTSEAYRDVYRNANKPLNFYSCMTDGKRLDPYSYYRLQAWTAWKEEPTTDAAMYFWAFNSTGGSTGGSSSWNEYNAAILAESPLFLDPNSSTVISGKHMEAIREGVEDFEYLYMLKNKIAVSTWHPQVAEAQTLLNGAADAVLNATGADSLPWSVSKSRETADQKRIEVLDMLESLNNVAAGKTYTMSPAPSYNHESGDATQLTDGSIYSGTGTFWTQTGCVGWNGASPTITINLSGARTIKGVSLHTAAKNTAGVYWPSAISIDVSTNNGSSYTNVGNLVALSNANNPAPDAATVQRIHRYETHALNQTGVTHVRLTITRNGSFAFADEIEVFTE